MKQIKVEASLFNAINEANGSYEFQSRVTRGPRQTWLTDAGIANTDLMEPCKNVHLSGWWQLWDIVDGAKSPVTCVVCPFFNGDNNEVHEYVCKKTKRTLHVKVTDVEAMRLTDTWYWFVKLEKVAKPKHTYQHSLLTYDELDTIHEFIDMLAYTDASKNTEFLYQMTKKNKLTLEQFTKLSVFLFKD